MPELIALPRPAAKRPNGLSGFPSTRPAACGTLDLSAGYPARRSPPRAMADDRSSSLSTHASLLQRARGRDALAWERVVALYGPLVLSWCRSSGLRDADAAEIGRASCRERV